MEVEAQLGADVGIRKLFVRQLDGQADGFAAGLVRAAIGRFHDAGTASGADNKPAGLGTERQCPGGDLVRKQAGFFVVARHFQRAFGFA